MLQNIERGEHATIEIKIYIYIHIYRGKAGERNMETGKKTIRVYYGDNMFIF